MSEWTPNDYSNILTVGAAALCSVLLILFKSRCSNISICFGLLSCKRKPLTDDEEPDPKKPIEPIEPIIPPRRSARLAVPEPEIEAVDPVNP